jgi:hypothetical protein
MQISFYVYFIVGCVSEGVAVYHRMTAYVHTVFI